MLKQVCHFQFMITFIGLLQRANRKPEKVVIEKLDRFKMKYFALYL